MPSHFTLTPEHIHVGFHVKNTLQLLCFRGLGQGVPHMELGSQPSEHVG